MQTFSTAQQLLRPSAGRDQQHHAARPAFGRALKPAARCSAAPASAADGEASGATRRGVLLSLTAAGLLAKAPGAFAEEGEPEIKTFYGMASPPTSYGGYGGNANEKPKYSFQCPASWKPDTINKTDKGTQGIDARVYNPRNKSKKEQVFVITLSRAGEDAAQFALRDIDSTLAGFAGADYDMQDALSYATENVSQKREAYGQNFYDIKLVGPDVGYLATITVNGGKVFAMFVKAPIKAFKDDEAKYRAIIDSFQLLEQ